MLHLNWTMEPFRKLVRTLQKEHANQEKLLEVLAKERAAIVELNQEELDKIGSEKSRLVEDGAQLEGVRRELLERLAGCPVTDERFDFQEVVASCPEQSLKADLSNAGQELKAIAISAKELSAQNAELIKDTLGLIATTISLFHSAPETELPTYGQSGKLSTDSDEPSTSQKGKSLEREA